MATGWPVTLTDGDVRLRPLRRRDGRAWLALRAANTEWLDPWEASSPANVPGPLPTFGEFVRAMSAQARGGSALPFAVDYRGELVGQLTVSSIVYGSLRSAAIGYWVSQRVAGRGIIPTATALAGDHCFRVLGLHRLEINIRTENAPSLRVVTKLGFRDEGVRERYLHIAGQWCDHRTFALTAEEVPEGLLARWHATNAARGGSGVARTE
ncbi:GNAT family N-acetyltransferase [Pengzhenrongella sicca]|uniref:GNAT family N-acetyltransferase n=1 Tax=Pengzhenrongella sicca TaxID=2819238 RepID=A0A8A4ZAK4_9MICO|nr:GNAT family protein [Pengzhenrongella sicca]QTE28952.1 GNAT family N-acetyltransferase [Pengzhenrongella sicca]